MSESEAKGRSRLDPEPAPRRDFLGMSAVGACLGASALAMLGMLRLPKVAVTASPSKKFRVHLPDSMPAGEPWVPPGRNVAIFRDAEGVYAISLVCTHLGCIVKAGSNGFECPCHGSRFNSRGEVVGGPAPKALPWHPVTVEGSELLIDLGGTVKPGTKVRA